jgi:hypothetical protein
MVDRLEASKTLSTVDDAALYQYCCLFAETEGILEARRQNAALVKTLLTAIARLKAAAAHGEAGTDEIVVDLSDTLAQIVKLRQLDAQYTTQLRQGHMAVRQYLVEFGMTPAARARVKSSATPEPEDPFHEFDDPAVGGPTH